MEKMKSHRVVRRVMNITVVRGKRSEKVEVPDGATPQDLCASLGLIIDAHIVLRNNVPVPLDEVIGDGDVIKIIKVASGG